MARKNKATCYRTVAGLNTSGTLDIFQQKVTNMPVSLLRLAEHEGIKIEYWDFKPPLEAIYWSYPGLPPVIGISNTITSRAHFRCVLAEELGHHFMTVGETIPKTFCRYRDRLEISKAEYQALKWAALHLIPLDKLQRAIRLNIKQRWELADYFDVTEEMIDFRLRLLDINPKEKAFAAAWMERRAN